MPAMHDRLTAVDLNKLTEDEMSVLRQEAIRLRLPFSEYLSRLVANVSAQLLDRVTTKPPQKGARQ